MLDAMMKTNLGSMASAMLGLLTSDTQAAREQATCRLRHLQVLFGVPQEVIDEALADEAERECGVRTNISTDAIDRVSKKLMMGELRPQDPVRSPWDRVPTCVRGIVTQLGITTVWSALDWFSAMDAAVEREVDERRLAERLYPTQCVALRDQCFAMLGNMEPEQVERLAAMVARVGARHGFHVAVDLFGIVIKPNLVVQFGDRGGPATPTDEVSFEPTASFDPPEPDKFAVSIEGMSFARARSWNIGDQLARRLGRRRG
jgi:hypothetical protein